MENGESYERDTVRFLMFPFRFHGCVSDGRQVRESHAAEIRRVLREAVPGEVTVAFLAGAPDKLPEPPADAAPESADKPE